MSDRVANLLLLAVVLLQTPVLAYLCSLAYHLGKHKALLLTINSIKTKTS
jgi:hypothetical protein